MLKSFLSLTLALFLSIIPLTNAAFQDVPSNHPHAAAVEFVESYGIVNGYPDGTFRPNQTINRAEFVKILIETIFDQDSTNTCLQGSISSFLDVETSIWFAKYVCMAKKFAIVNGYPDGNFGPGLEINFAEAAKIIANSAALNIEPLQAGEQWYEPFITALSKLNAVPDDLTSPTQKLTRGQMAEIIYRLRSYFNLSETNSSEPSNQNASTYQTERQQVINLVNQERSKQGLGAMRFNAKLEQAAQGHADDMRTRNYFEHDTPEGITPDERIEASGYYQEFFDCNCAGKITSGENIAKGQSTAAEVMETWMNSPPHRENILNPDFDEIGIGITPVDPNDVGFQGFFWVQNFGKISLEQ